MQLLALARRHALATALLAGAVLGTMVGLFLPIRAAKPPASVEQDWVLPTPTQIAAYDKADFERVRRARFWGDAANARGEGARNAPWELLAILLRPIPRIAVAAGSGQKPVWYRIGDKLPDGAVLVGMDKDAAHLEREGCRYARKMYQSAAEKRADPCAAAPAAPAAGAAPRTSSPASGTPGQPIR